jgi:hypothetical protein
MDFISNEKGGKTEIIGCDFDEGSCDDLLLSARDGANETRTSSARVALENVALEFKVTYNFVATSLAETEGR